MGHKDVRELIEIIEQDGELQKINGANWDLEMSGITELLYREGRRPVPALLFDDIVGYPKGYRTLFGLVSSPRRLSRALNLPVSNDSLAVVQSLRNKMRSLKLVPPRLVDSGPVMENQLTGDAIDLYKFPIPRHNELDGGRYIGTGHAIIIQDPETGCVNLGTYRNMLVDHNRIALHVTESKHGGLIRDKYLSQNKVMPIAFATGIDPALYVASCDAAVPFGVSEYDYAGGLKGEPLETFKGPYTGIPLPANAEFVIEGECHPGDMVDEGPFGEWMGNYANLGKESVLEPVIRVKAIYHRNNPILNCSHPSTPPSEMSSYICIVRAAMFWNGIEKLGIPGIKAVWCHEEGGGSLLTAVSIRQMYAGHAKRTGLIADLVSQVKTKYTIVVDEDIDPSNLSQVIWAVATRADPVQAIQILSRCGTSSADTTVSPEEKRKWKTTPKPLYSSRAIIDACRPFEWKHEWYPVAKISSDRRSQLLEKWSGLFKELC